MSSNLHGSYSAKRAAFAVYALFHRDGVDFLITCQPGPTEFQRRQEKHEGGDIKVGHTQGSTLGLNFLSMASRCSL